MPTFRGALARVASARFIAQLARWGITFVVIRLMTEEAYALMSLADICVGFAIMFVGGSLAATIVQLEELVDEDIQEAKAFGFLAGTLIALVVCASGPAMARIYGKATLVPLLLIGAIPVFLSGVYSSHRAYMARELRFGELSVLDVLGSVIGVVSTLVMALLGWGVYALMLGWIVDQLFRTAYLVARSGIGLWVRFAFRPGFRQRHALNIDVTVSSIFWFIYVRVDVVLAGLVFDTKVFGVYAVASQMAIIPVNKLLPVVKNVLFPFMSDARRRKVDTAAKFNKGLLVLMAFIFPVSVGMFAVAEAAIPLVLGEKWRAVTEPFALLALTIPLRFFAEIFSPALQSEGNGRQVVINEVIMAISVSAACGVGFYLLDWGIAQAVLIGFSPGALLVAILSYRVLGISLWPLVVGLGRISLCCAGMWAAVYTAAEHVGLAGQIAVGLVSYGALALLLLQDLVRSGMSLAGFRK